MSREEDIALLVAGDAEIGRQRAERLGEAEGGNRIGPEDASKLLAKLERCQGRLGLRGKVRLRGAAEELLYLTAPGWVYADAAHRDSTSTTVAEELITRYSGHVVRYALRDGDFVVQIDS